MLLLQSTLVVLVPAAEQLVRPYRKKYDPSAVAGMPAHITWRPPITWLFGAVCDSMSGVCAGGAEMRGQAGFFDIDERLKQLSAKGDGLERLSAVVDFELFRADLERAVRRSERARGGRPPFDHVLMFKALVLQASHNLSDERTEYLIRDRLSFMRFLGLGLADAVPDANTIWT